MEAASVNKPARVCVFTVLIGQYEKLNEQAVAAQSAIPFICLTDDPNLRSESWRIREVVPLFGMDPIRSQRDLKLRPHVHLPDFDYSLYIDNTVMLTEVPEKILEANLPASGFGLPEHSGRELVIDEFLEVARLGYDDPGRLFEQLNHYTIDCPEVLNEKPYWAAILLRDHRNPKVREMLETWAAHVLRYSRRDQLSINAAFRHVGLVPDIMKIDNRRSWFHSWPHEIERNREKWPRLPAGSLTPAGAQIRQLEQKNRHLEQARADFLSSSAVRFALFLSKRGRRYPRLGALARRVLKFCGLIGRPPDRDATPM